MERARLKPVEPNLEINYANGGYYRISPEACSPRRFLAPSSAVTATSAAAAAE